MNLKQLAKELNLSFSTVSKALRDSREKYPNEKYSTGKSQRIELSGQSISQ